MYGMPDTPVLDQVYSVGISVGGAISRVTPAPFFLNKRKTEWWVAIMGEGAQARHIESHSRLR